MKKQLLFSLAACASLMVGSALANNDPTANVKASLKEPNPYADYHPAMASTAEKPLMWAWQKQNAKKLAEETSDAKLDAFLASDAAADALLAQVKEAYKSDPIVMIQIASVTQRAQVSSKEVLARWVAALRRAKASAKDNYRWAFYRDQLTLCGER